MADIDQIIASGAKKRMPIFGGIAGIADSYWAGLDQKQKRLEREVFKEGIPTNADGSPDYSAAAKKLYQIGQVDKANTLANLDIQRQQLQLGQQASQALGGIEGGGNPPLRVPTVGPSSNIPPSSSRPGGDQIAPSTVSPQQPQSQPRGVPQASASPGQYRGGDAPGSIVGLVSAAGVPDELAGPIIQQVSASTRTDPNAPLNPQIAPRVQQVIARLFSG